MSAQPAVRLDPEVVPGTMLAWQVEAPGAVPEALGLVEIDVPVPGEGELLVEVWSAGLGPADVQAVAAYAAGDPAFVPGQELCGEVVGVGPGVSRARLGERIVGVTRRPHGSLARFAVTRATDVLAAPLRLDDAAASVFHVAFQVGWTGLYRRAALRVGETLVVLGADTGLGAAAVQLGRAAGARVIGVVTSPDDVAAVRALGAELVLVRDAEGAADGAGDGAAEAGVVAAVREATRGQGAEVVFDPTGGDTVAQSLAMAAFEGRVVLVGAGAADAVLPASAVRAANVTVHGVQWHDYLDARPEIVARAHADLTSLVEVGALRCEPTAKLLFEDAPQGLAGAGTGRIAVSPP